MGVARVTWPNLQILGPPYNFWKNRDTRVHSPHISAADHSIQRFWMLLWYRRHYVSKFLLLSMVRSLLDYCVPVWVPYKKGDIEVLEKVQKKATKIIPEIRHLPYVERLKACKLPTLRFRQVRGDMIEMYKILRRTHRRCLECTIRQPEAISSN